jgi:hypothetical protein
MCRASHPEYEFRILGSALGGNRVEPVVDVESRLRYSIVCFDRTERALDGFTCFRRLSTRAIVREKGYAVDQGPLVF